MVYFQCKESWYYFQNIHFPINRSSHQRYSLKKVFLEISQNSRACNFIKKETLTQVFSCEFSEISKNTFFTEHVWATDSIKLLIYTETIDVNY